MKTRGEALVGRAWRALGNDARGRSFRVREFGRAIARRHVWLPLSLAAVLLVGAWTRRWIADDGFIYLRVARNVLEGNGPVFNQGIRVEAGTSPLWTSIVAFLAWVFPVSLESLVVGLGLVLSALGIWAATRASLKISGGRFPFGLAALAATPLVWDFSTSGLETSVALAFLGASALALVRFEADDVEDPGPLWGMALFGLGPLIRPDLAVVSAVFIFVGLLAERRKGRPVLRLLTTAVALPVFVQIARMGYYRAFLPNTALAKEAGTGDWWSGFQYLLDALLVPGVAFVAVSVIVSVGGSHLLSKTRRSILLAAALHGVVIVYVGGDFMRLRLFLPAVFLLAITATGGAGRIQLAGLAFAVLSTVILMQLPPSYDSLITPAIQDQRAIASMLFGPHPMRRADIPPEHRFNQVLRLNEGDPSGLIELPLSDGPIVHEAGRGILLGPIGMVGFYAGPETMIWDRFALSDPIGARFKTEETGRRKGHEKYIDNPWFDARMEGTPLGSDDSAAAAFLECPRLKDFLAGITAPLDVERLWDNLAWALPDTFLRFPSDPARALEECGAISRPATP